MTNEADADAADELAAEHTALLRVEADLRNSIPVCVHLAVALARRPPRS